jgi:acyl-CoA reductase-like NAD-dependent aldehyde dehydrogenase
MNPHHDELFIGGRWAKPASDGRITVLGASTEDVLGSVPEGTEKDMDAAVAAARAAFDDPDGWSHWEPARRADALCRLADALERRSKDITRIVSAQNGMTIGLSEQVEGALPAILLRYYGRRGVLLLGLHADEGAAAQRGGPPRGATGARRT